eukprot:COSAG05_NODE_15860_length_359_cov_0.796154_1_plen_58_part_10
MIIVVGSVFISGVAAGVRSLVVRGQKTGVTMTVVAVGASSPAAEEGSNSVQEVNGLLV